LNLKIAHHKSLGKDSHEQEFHVMGEKEDQGNSSFERKNTLNDSKGGG
jgi:hypothetical protein